MNFKNKIWNLCNWLQQSIFFTGNLRVLFLRSLGFKLHSSARIASGVFIGSKKLEMHENTFININSFMDGNDRIILETNVRLGPYVKILTGTHSIDKNVIRRGKNSIAINAPVLIKRGSWIGMGATILPGVIIAEGCVVGAGSVVIKSTEPNGLYAGIPAKRIKNLPL